MPFKSEAQRRLLWMKRPDVAEKWAHEGKNKGLPYHKAKDKSGGKIRFRKEKGKAVARRK